MKHLAKAAAGAAVAFTGALALAGLDNQLDLAEWLLAIAAGVASAGTVYGVPYAPAPGRHRAE